MGRHSEAATEHPPVRRHRAFLGLFAVLALALVLLPATCALPSGEDGANGEPSGAPEDPAAELGWGFTHTQYSADTGQAEARRRAATELAELRLPQNQHIMGWGAGNPEPSPGQYDFSALDSRIEYIRETEGTPVITLCCAPDWMKGGRPGTTDWNELETAPLPEHYQDFADLARTVAERYPDVRHFIVWNELKGFWDDEQGRWDYEGYTRLYNLVYRELKEADPRNLVGGPYVVLDSHPPGEDHQESGVRGPWGSIDRRALAVISYWNRHRVGADFVVVDGSSYTRNDRLVPDTLAATDKFTEAGRWVRATTGLPLWWAEWYVEPGDEDGLRDDWSERRRVAVHAAGMIAMARGGAGTGFYWNPQRQSPGCSGCLWSSTEAGDGGSRLPMLDLLGRFATAFPPGTAFRDGIAVSGADAAGVRVLADDHDLLVVNARDRPASVQVDGRSFDLDRYEVRWAG